MSQSSSRKLTTDTLTEVWLKALGWNADQCQRQTGLIKRDLYGFADQCAFAGRFHLLVQTTTVSNLASRRSKVLGHPNALKWKRADRGNLIFLLGWRDQTGQKPPRLEEVQLERNKLVSVSVKDAIAVADVRDL